MYMVVIPVERFEEVRKAISIVVSWREAELSRILR
jgi:hypothetical protein